MENALVQPLDHRHTPDKFCHFLNTKKQRFTEKSFVLD